MPGLSWGDESVSPYIDSLKAKMSEQDLQKEPVRTSENPEPYIQSLKQKMPAQELGTGTEPYIDSLKAKNPEKYAAPPSASYTEEKQAVLGADKNSGGAIQAVADNHSELQLKRPGSINAAFGFKIGTAVNRDFTGSSQYVSQSFQSIYGSGWAPALTLFVAYMPFYSRAYGSLGITGSIGGGFFKGNGVYKVPLYKTSGAAFPSQSITRLTFIDVPVSLGVKYQINWGKYFVPFVEVAPTVIGMAENRNDGIGSKKALSKGVTTSAGFGILLDWITRSNTWNVYQDFNVKHYYLTAEYSKLTTFSSPIDVSFSGVDVGVTFEF